MRILAIILRVFGVVIIGISVVHVAIGPTWMPDAGTVTPSGDSQHRFYTALFSFFGIALFWACGDLHARMWIVRWVAYAFLVGGLARLLSIATVGLPHWLFVALGTVELTAPLFVLWLSAQAFKDPVAGR